MSSIDGASSPDNARTFGRIEIHAHLLPGVDDGCRDTAESIAVARELVARGYTHLFCTPHIWPSLPENHPAEIARRVGELQDALDAAAVPLRLFAGGEINLVPEVARWDREQMVSYHNAGRVCLFDFWYDDLPRHFAASVDRMKRLGLQPIVAHPERVGCVQRDPTLVDRFRAMGLLIQGNLQCFGDPPGARTRVLAERFLTAGRYDLLAGDVHRLDSLEIRFRGLDRAIELIGTAKVEEMISHRPRALLFE